MFQSSSEAALHVPLYQFGVISQASLLCLPVSIAIQTIRTIINFEGEVQYRADGLGGIILPHRFCTAARWETSLCVMESIVAAFATRERLPS